MRYAVCILAVSGLAACGGPVSPADTGAPIDAPRADVAADRGPAPDDAADDASSFDAGDLDGGSTDAIDLDVPSDVAIDRPSLMDAPRADAADGGDAGTPSVLLLGRIDYRQATGPRFQWSGSSIVARFTGTAVTIRLDDSGANFFRVAVDGAQQSTLHTMRGAYDYPVATGLAAGTHTVELWRRTEANAGVTQYLGISFPTGGALLPPPARATRRIEVIGDSITCGYGDEGTAPCNFTYDTENNYAAWGSTAARALGAEVHTVSWSGWGMYRDYSHTMTGVIPNVYGRTLPGDATSTWDTASWIPNAIVINLGTNDYSMNSDPGQPYTDAYVAFLRRLRGYYPSAYIIAAIGPTTRPAARIMTAVSTVRAGGDTRVQFLQLGGNAGDNGGCNGHPTVAAQAAMGAQVTTALRTALHW